MRIYNGWKIKSLDDDSSHLHGAEITGSQTIRGTQRYFLKMPNGTICCIKRVELLKGVGEKTIEFY